MLSPETSGAQKGRAARARVTRPHVVLRSSEDVSLLLASLRRSFTIPRASLEITGLPPVVRRRFEARLNLYAGQCGCFQGSAAGATALFACLGYHWWSAGELFRWQLGEVGLAAGVVLCAMALGKLVSLTRARSLVVAELEQLERDTAFSGG